MTFEPMVVYMVCALLFVAGMVIMSLALELQRERWQRGRKPPQRTAQSQEGLESGGPLVDNGYTPSQATTEEQ